MASGAIQLRDLSGQLDAAALGSRRIALTVDAGVLRVSAEALGALLRPKGLVVIGIDAGRIGVRLRVGFAEVTAGLRPAADRGRLRLEVAAVQAFSFLPIPPAAAAAVIRALLPSRPGIYPGERDYIEADLAELLRPLGIELPPLRAASAQDGYVELQF
jgi:hypothetical protein